MKLIYSFLIVMLLASCSGGSTTRQVGNTDDFTDLTAQDDVFIDALGVLPLDGSAIAKYTVRVNNNSTQNYALESVRVGAEQAEPWAATSKLLKLDAAACKKLAAASSCDLQLTPYASASVDVLILLNFRDVYGNQKEVKQMVRMSQDVKHNNGFAIFNDLNNLMTKDSVYSLALPLILERDFESINALNGFLRCQDPGFRQGNHCSYLIKGKALADNTLLTTQLTGFAAGKKVAQNQANILIRNKAAANLVLSHGVRLITDGRTTSDLSIYNNGTAPAQFKISVDAAVEIVAGQECLKQALATQSECRVSLRSKGNQQHRASAFIVYYDEKSVSTNLNYTSPDQASLLNISTSNSLQNTPISTSNQQILTITNTSNNNLSGVAVAIAGAKPAHLILGLLAQAQGGCSSLNDITLAAGASCHVALQYSPTESENATTQLQVSVAAAEQQTEMYSYFVDYSAIKPTNYLAISQIKNVTLAATGNNTQEEESFSLTNLAPAVPLQLNQVILEDLSTQLKLSTDSCAVGTILDEQHPQCSGRISYNSVISDATSKSAHLAVLYGLKKTDNSDVYSRSNDFTFVRKPSTVIDPPIDPEPVFESGVKIIESFVVEVSGDGATVQEHELASEPYRVFVKDSKLTNIILKYTFTNMGSESATDFRVDPGKVSKDFDDAMKKLRPHNSTEPVKNHNDCINVLAAKGGSCTVQLMWKSVLNTSKNGAKSSAFGLNLDYCYATNTEGSLCKSALKNQKLEVTLGLVSDFKARFLYNRSQLKELLESVWGVPSLYNKYALPITENEFLKGRMKGILELDLSKYNFKTDSKNIKVSIQDSYSHQLGNPPNHTTLEIDYTAGSDECNLEDDRPCLIDVEYKDSGTLVDNNCSYLYEDLVNGGTTYEEENYSFDDCRIGGATNLIINFTDNYNNKIHKKYGDAEWFLMMNK